MDNETVGLKAIIVKYLLYWKVFVIVGVISVIPAILYLVLYPRTYEMMTRVQIQEEDSMSGTSFGLGEAAGLMKSFGLGGGSVGTINIEDEVRNMTTISLLSDMVYKLGVNVEYKEPMSFFKIYNSPVIVSTDSATHARLDEEIEFGVKLSGNKISVRVESVKNGKKKFEFTSLPAVMTLADGPFVLDYPKTTPNENSSIKKLNIVYRPSTWVAEDIAEDFLIEEVSKTSSIIEMSCTDHERERGLDMLNTLITCYNELNSTFKSEDSQKTMAFLDTRIDSITTALYDVEAEIAYYKNQNNLTDIEQDVKFYVEQMKELQVKLIELEAQVHTIRLMSDYVKDPANKYSLVPMLLSQESSSEGGGGPITMYNEVLMERSRVILNSDMSNPLVTTLTKQADNLRESVKLSILNTEKSLEITIQDVKKKEQALYDMMGSYPDQEKEFVELKRQQEIYQGVYLILLQKREEAALIGSNIKEKARVIDAAFVKAKPVGPRKLFAAIFMFAFTLIGSIGYIFCKEQYAALKEEFVKTKQS